MLIEYSRGAKKKERKKKKVKEVNQLLIPYVLQMQEDRAGRRAKAGRRVALPARTPNPAAWPSRPG